MYLTTGLNKIIFPINRKQKIVILIDWYLPGTKAGGPVRSIYSLVNLIKDHFDLCIITSNCDLGSDESYKNILSNRLFSGDGVHYYYFSKDQLTPDNVVKQIQEINPDLVYLNSFWSYPFSIAIVKAKKNGAFKVPVLLATRGMLGKGALSLKPLKKKIYLMLAKLSGWYKGITFHATNKQEFEDIKCQFKNAKIITVANTNSGKVLRVEKIKAENHIKLFYLSRIARVKNLHIALNILGKVGANVHIEYDIYGNLEDREYWNECQSIIEKLPSNIKVNYKGELDFDKVQSVIVNYDALLLPTLNENFGHSIVESLLCGCLVIISDQTPWNDIYKSNAGFALPLNNEDGFVKAVNELAGLANEAYKIRSEAAISYISSKLNLEKSLEEYKNLFYESAKN